MAFPFLLESNFEQGTNVEWSSEVDTGSLLNYPHYSKLARYNATLVGPIAPWRGAFVAEWLLGDTNDHTLISSASISIANAATGWTRFYLFLGKNLTATADDVFSIYELQGTANAQECVVALKITAATGAIQIGNAQTQADIVFGGNPLTRGRWLCIEVSTAVVTGSATGTSQVFVDGTALSAAVTNLAVNTAIVRGVLGSQDTLATTTGYMFMDAFVFDDLRIGMMRDRYPDTVMITKSTHLGVGQTDLLNVTLLPGTGTNSVLKVWDTDQADTSDENNVQAYLFNLTASEPPIDLADLPMVCRRGAYIELSGTAPRALVHIGNSQGWGSHGRVRQHGYNRSQAVMPSQ